MNGSPARQGLLNYGRRKLIVVMAVTSGWTFGEIDDDDDDEERRDKGQRSEVEGQRRRVRRSPRRGMDGGMCGE